MAQELARLPVRADETHLVLTVTVDGKLPADGIAAAARLMDTVIVDGRVVRMTKRRPANARTDLRTVREQLAAMLPESTLDELRRNNHDLIAALEDLKGQKEQLLLLNDLVLTDLVMPGVDGSALLERLPAALPAIVITGLDVATPARAAALLRKSEVTRERLAFAIRGIAFSGGISEEGR